MTREADRERQRLARAARRRAREAGETVHVSTADVVAWCHACPWQTVAANGLGNSARHHDATGHAVTVNTHRTVTYGDPDQPHPGQTTMLDAITNGGPA